MFSAVKLTNSKPRFQLWCMECVHSAGPRQPKQEYILSYEQWTKSPAGNRGYYHYSVALKECMDVPCVRHCQCPRVRLFCQNDRFGGPCSDKGQWRWGVKRLVLFDTFVPTRAEENNSFHLGLQWSSLSPKFHSKGSLSFRSSHPCHLATL